MKVLFTCDVTKSVGAGHLIRSIAIAEHARERGLEVIFCGTYETAFSQSALRDADFDVLDFSGDSHDLARLAVDIGVDIVHSDDYYESRRSLHTCLSRVGIVLSSMEDGGYGARDADIIVDPTPGAESRYRPDAPSAVHLRGLEYAPLRQEVIAAANERTSSQRDLEPPVRSEFRIVIVLGGTDAADATKSIAAMWVSEVPGTICTVIMPGRNSELTENYGSSRIHWVPPTRNIAKIFAGADAVITASGTTLWELAAVGVPAAVILQAENQRSNYDFVVNSGLMIGLGGVGELAGDDSKIRSGMKLLRSTAFSGRRSALISLAGAQKIVSEWVDSISSRSVLRLRPARMSDASNLFDWRNHEEVRAVSRDSSVLEWETHIAWLRSVLSNPNRCLLIAAVGSECIGTVRFDQVSDDPNLREISITVGPKHRGQRFGDRLLITAERFVREQIHGATEILASVKAEHRASSDLFARNGYKQHPQELPSSLVRWSKLLR